VGVNDHRERWLQERTTRCSPEATEEALRRKQGTTVSLVLPARNEVGTIGPLVRGLVSALQEQTRLIDELVVFDDLSVDSTGAAAAAAGARVVTHADIHPEVPPAGKGCAMWKGLAATTGDLVLFLDADVTHFPPHWVASLVLPLLRDAQVSLVKATYDRPLEVGGVAHPASGGRVTRLVATPILNLIEPDLVVFGQPLAGETAARRDLLERVAFRSGYGVELQLLLDAHAAVGLDGLAQVDLGAREHRHQSDAALGSMATALLHVAAHRTVAAHPPAAEGLVYARVVREGDHLRLAKEAVLVDVLPPLRQLLPGPG
jgi:glucosyl-3-phosphoglycerate synthase